MKKIIIVCYRTDQFKSKINLATYFQGWLMKEIPVDLAQKYHRISNVPYSISTSLDEETITFTISLLDREAEKVFSDLLLDNQLVSFCLEAFPEDTFNILSKRTENLSKEELAKVFYNGESDNGKFKIYFQTPTSFKSNGKYVMYPDLRLLLQSLMRQYNCFFEGTQIIDRSLLDELLKHVYVSSYQLNSFHYPIHKVRIPAFLGHMSVICKGNKTLANYLEVLLKIGEYTGVGIKTSMGMGAIKVRKMRR